MTVSKIFALGLAAIFPVFGWVALAMVIHHTVGEPWGQVTFAAPFVVGAVFIVGLIATDFLPASK